MNKKQRTANSGFKGIKMKIMNKYPLFILLLVVICSCSIQKKNSSGQEKNILGIWTENWGKDTIDSESDVTYVDTLHFYKNLKGKIQITCINSSNYIYRKIKLKDSILTFTMENIVDPKEKFFVYYKFVVTNEKELDGEIVNSKNQKENVKLIKIK